MKKIWFYPLLFNIAILFLFLFFVLAFIFTNGFNDDGGYGGFAVLLYLIIFYLFIALPLFSIWYAKISVKSTNSIVKVILANALTNTLLYFTPFIPLII